MRNVTIERNVAPKAEGSCLIGFGSTRVLCTATVETSLPSWRRGQGLGWVMGDVVLRLARTLGVRTVYLATTNAADFFGSRLGFRPVELDAIDPGIRDTANFQAATSFVDAVCMELALDPNEDPGD